MDDVKFDFTLNDINHLLLEMYDFMNSILIYLPPNLQVKAKCLIDKTNKITTTEFNPYLNMDRKKLQDTCEEYVQPVIAKTSYKHDDDEDIENYEIPNSVNSVLMQTEKSTKEQTVEIVETNSTTEQQTSRESTLSTEVQSDEFPYRQFSASQISVSAIKYGPLLRQGTFWYLKRFRKLRKCYAVIRDTWLIIYLSDHDSKPHQYVNLINCTAVAQTGDPKKDFMFEIRSKSDGRKLYQFNAYTSEDREQWIYLINDIGKDAYAKIVQHKNNRQLPSVPSLTDTMEDYEIVNTMDFEQSQSAKIDDNMYAIVGQTNSKLQRSTSVSIKSFSSDIYTSVDNYYSNVQENRDATVDHATLMTLITTDNEDKYETVGTVACKEKRTVPLISHNSFLHRHAKKIK